MWNVVAGESGNEERLQSTALKELLTADPRFAVLKDAPGELQRLLTLSAPFDMSSGGSSPDDAR